MRAVRGSAVDQVPSTVGTASENRRRGRRREGAPPEGLMWRQGKLIELVSKSLQGKFSLFLY